MHSDDTEFLILLTFVIVLRVVLVNMIAILMMSIKVSTPDLLGIKLI